MIKRLCHSCKCDFPLEFLVPCRNTCCNRLYCRKCLTSRYKYSRVKASHLPTPNWKCPVCTRRCWCADCVNEGVPVKIQKAISKSKIITSTWYRKKRIRRSRKAHKSDQLEKLERHHQVVKVEKKCESLWSGKTRSCPIIPFDDPLMKSPKLNLQKEGKNRFDAPSFTPWPSAYKNSLPPIGGKFG
jgi:hypothetical protein